MDPGITEVLKRGGKVKALSGKPSSLVFNEETVLINSGTKLLKQQETCSSLQFSHFLNPQKGNEDEGFFDTFFIF